MKKIWFRIAKNYRIYIYLAIVLVLFSGYSDSVTSGKEAPSNNFRTIFGKKYNEALLYLITNSWIADTIRAYHVDPDFAQAIVFPEIIRYSTIRDKIEVAGLYSLYINYGESYANFSVGHFQMKPSFAQKIESDASKFGIFIPGIYKTNVADSEVNCRLERVKRLNSPLWQVRYLIAYIKILDQLYISKKWCHPNEKIKFYATAYNCGYWQMESNIQKYLKEKRFYISLIPGNRYNYASISLDFYLIYKTSS